MARLSLVFRLALVTVAIAGCSSTAATPASPPTRSSLASEWNIVLPDRVEGYAATVVGDTESQVTFAIEPSDLDALIADSELDLTAGRRVVTHASPLWELNPTGDISGATDEVDAGSRVVEVVTDGDAVTLRAVLNRSG